MPLQIRDRCNLSPFTCNASARNSPLLCIVNITIINTHNIMKKYIFTGLALLSLGFCAEAQTSDIDPREHVAFGVKAGLNISNVWDAEGQDFRADAKAGFAGGLYVGIPIATFLGFQPELLISQKGFQASGTMFATTYDFKRTTTYIDVPLQLQVKPLKFLTVLVGPQYSFLVHQQDVFRAGGSTFVQEQEFENDQIRKNILGFVAGTDIVVSHVVVSGRLGWDLLNNNGDGTTTTPRYKNRWIQLTLGFQI